MYIIKKKEEQNGINKKINERIKERTYADNESK